MAAILSQTNHRQSDNHWTQVIYCGPHKMTAILQTTLKCIFLCGNCCIFLEISFQFENTLDDFVNDVFNIFIEWKILLFLFTSLFFKWLAKNKPAFMQMTWGRVGGKPLYAEYQIDIGNTNNRMTCSMNYVLLTSYSCEMSLNTSQ